MRVQAGEGGGGVGWNLRAGLSPSYIGLPLATLSALVFVVSFSLCLAIQGLTP